MTENRLEIALAQLREEAKRLARHHPELRDLAETIIQDASILVGKILAQSETQPPEKTETTPISLTAWDIITSLAAKWHAENPNTPMPEQTFHKIKTHAKKLAENKKRNKKIP